MARIKVTEEMIQIDADVLAHAFEISLDDLKRNMRVGTITSQTECGGDDDAGKMRLTFFSHDRRVRITADESGKVLTCDAARIERPSSPASRKARIDALLDEALDESFPASDPIAISFESPHRAARSLKESDDG